MLRATALILVCPLPTPELAFAPAEGSRVRQSYLETTEWNLQSIGQRIDGAEFPVEQLTGMACVTASERVLVDHHRSMRGGRPLTLERAVERAAATSEMVLTTPMGTVDVSVTSESELVDELLVFRWDGDRADYGVELESDRTPRALGSVRVEAGLQGLLGEGDLELGARWSVDAAAFVDALSAGGDLDLVPDSIPVLPGDGVSGPDLIGASAVRLLHPWDVVEGEVDLVWQETVETDGRELARIAIDGELELDADLEDWLERILSDAGADGGEREDYRAAIRWVVDVAGELRWDVDRGHFQALELEADGEARVRLGWLDPVGAIEIEALLATETELNSVARPETR